MSLGFSVGNFLAVGQLTIQLWRAFKDAPQEFAEITRELCSINIAIADLSDQAGSQMSLLNRRGKDRKEELLTLSNNLQSTLEELSDLHRNYQYMGYNAWKRVRLGERDLTALRTKLVLHLNLLNGFTTSLAMASIVTMKPLMVEIFNILRNSARGNKLGAHAILEAQSSVRLASGENNGWEQVEEELKRVLGIPRGYVQEHRHEIQILLDEVIEVEGLSTLDDVYPGDSASHIAPAFIITSQMPDRTSLIPQSTSDDGMTQSLPSLPHIQAEDSALVLLGGASQEEIRVATINIMNYGYDLNKVCAPRGPPPPKIPKNKALRIFKSYAFPEDRTTPIPRDPRNAYSAAALCAAARRCNLLAVQLVLQKDADVNSTQDDKSALLQAIESNHSDLETTTMLKLLVQRGANVNLRVKCPGYPDRVYEDFAFSPPSNLCAAVKAGKVNAVIFLLDQGVNIDEMGKTYRHDVNCSSALGIAARQHDEVLVKLLLSRGASVNIGPVKYAEFSQCTYRQSCMVTPLEECLSNKEHESKTEEILRAAGGIVSKYPCQKGELLRETSVGICAGS